MRDSITLGMEGRSNSGYGVRRKKFCSRERTSQIIKAYDVQDYSLETEKYGENGARVADVFFELAGRASLKYLKKFEQEEKTRRRGLISLGSEKGERFAGGGLASYSSLL